MKKTAVLRLIKHTFSFIESNSFCELQNVARWRISHGSHILLWEVRVSQTALVLVETRTTESYVYNDDGQCRLTLFKTQSGLLLEENGYCRASPLTYLHLYEKNVSKQKWPQLRIPQFCLFGWNDKLLQYVSITRFIWTKQTEKENPEFNNQQKLLPCGRETWHNQHSNLNNMKTLLICTCLFAAMVASVAQAAETYKVDFPLDLVINQQCFDSLYGELNYKDVECLKMVLSKLAGYGIVGGAGLLKVPIIINILRNKSATGLSSSSLYLETSLYICNLVYCYFQQLPIR